MGYEENRAIFFRDPFSFALHCGNRRVIGFGVVAGQSIIAASLAKFLILCKEMFALTALAVETANSSSWPGLTGHPRERWTLQSRN
jgi:hypothetical protein